MTEAVTKAPPPCRPPGRSARASRELAMGLLFLGPNILGFLAFSDDGDAGGDCAGADVGNLSQQGYAWGEQAKLDWADRDVGVCIQRCGLCGLGNRQSGDDAAAAGDRGGDPGGGDDGGHFGLPNAILYPEFYLRRGDDAALGKDV